MGDMRKLVTILASLALWACGHVSEGDAKQIAYERLSAIPDGPSLKGDALKFALTVSEEDKEGRYLVELTDEERNLLWAVIVHSSGNSEISRMAIDG